MCMMPASCIFNCFMLYESDWFHSVIGEIDLSLTSSIATSFFWSALSDAGFIDARKNKKWLWAMLASYVLLFLAWYIMYFSPWKVDPTMTFKILYMGVVGVTCGTYVIVEIVLMIVKSQPRGRRICLLLAGLTGGFGFVAIEIPSVNEWLCHSLGPLFAGNFWWFLFSDVAMFLLFCFFMCLTKNTVSQQTLPTSTHTATAPVAVVVQPQKQVEMATMPYAFPNTYHFVAQQTGAAAIPASVVPATGTTFYLYPAAQ
eukprot:TRINITY_DN1293_c0_g1_i3.p1 TRINITY_DN1293_c0_g1~~TRINITY_DN1293_c0_g1_i3.p1  ORF type:complete len:257 (+),score=59.92 TRINITY_DN1293_c0_g1_i3:412-1182(+)